MFVCCVTRYYLQLRIQWTPLHEEKTNLERHLHFIKQKIAISETQQAAAVTSEDFELADRLSFVLERLSEEVTELENASSGITCALSHLDEQYEVLVKRFIACFSGVKKQLKRLQDEQDDSRNDIENEVGSLFDCYFCD